MSRRDAINGRLFGNGFVRPKTGAYGAPEPGPLKQRFVFPPFSVWNTREGSWQSRKRAWLALGIQSEVGRDDKLTFNIPITLSDGRTGNKIRNQTSIFDPVLCEICYRYWCPEGGRVLDPFAGGSVRGVIASLLGYRYAGIELRAEQVAANRAQLAAATTGQYPPKWRAGDSFDVLDGVAAESFDFAFSCPPYGNLERYSDDSKDLSTMTYKDFLTRYREIIEKAAARLAPNRYAVFVVANYRDKKTGEFHDFVGDTVRAFRRAGLAFYNEIILVNAVGSAAMRANTSFLRGGRKIVKSHQNVLVFVKGDPKIAAQALPEEV